MTTLSTTEAPLTGAIHPARLNGVLFVTPDVANLRTYYEGLGWRSARTDDLFVPFALAGGAFALFDEPTAEGHAVGVRAAGIDFDKVVLCTVVDRADEVDSAAAATLQAGGRVVSEPKSTAYGRATWIADPSDTVWEICWIDGKTSGEPFAESPDTDALVPALQRVTLLRDAVAPLRAFYEGLGWSVTAPGDDDRSLDLDLDGIALSFRQDGADVAAIEANDNDVTGLVITLPVAADELSDTVAALVERGAVELSSDDGSGSAYLVDPAGLTWKLAVAA